MPSPFPGMDPYLESPDIWGDFHTTLLVAIRARLNALLPRQYRAKIDLFVFIQMLAERPRSRRRLEPDVFVVERSGSHSAAVAAPAAPPLTVTLPAIPKKQKAILIVDRKMNRVVTAIEVLSPTNKMSGKDRTAYLNKRGEYFGQSVSLVEVDLLRAGHRLPLGDLGMAIKDYYVMVCRGWEFPRADIWTFTIRDPLPAIPIPLAEGVAEPILSLRECLDRAYSLASYESEIDYHARPDPPLNKADSGWAKAFLASRNNAT